MLGESKATLANALEKEANFAERQKLLKQIWELERRQHPESRGFEVYRTTSSRSEAFGAQDEKDFLRRGECRPTTTAP